MTARVDAPGPALRFTRNNAAIIPALHSVTVLPSGKISRRRE